MLVPSRDIRVTFSSYDILRVTRQRDNLVQFLIYVAVTVKEENVLLYIYKYIGGKTHHELIIIGKENEVVISGGHLESGQGATEERD